MKNENTIKLLLPIISFLVACTSVSAKDDVTKSTSTESETSTAAPITVPAAVVTSPPAGSPEPDSDAIPSTCDVTPKLDRTQRLAVIAKVILDSENELEQQPESIKDPAVRARLGTFAAGSMSDSVRFVSMDQRCWSHLYEAQTKLAAEDDNGAKAASEAWKNCLEDQFPNRIAIAQPYFSCFVAAKTKRK